MKTEIEIANYLLTILNRNKNALAGHFWVNEKKRFEELLFCFIYSSGFKNSKECRRIIRELEKKRFLDPLTLSLTKKNSPNFNKIVEIICNQGVIRNNDKIIAEIIINVSKIIQKNYNGKIQRLLRLFGRVINEEMLKIFVISNLNRKQRSFASVLWLQNCLNIPLSFMHPITLSFCKKHKIRPNQLKNASDLIDLNLAVLDDVLLLDKSKNNL